MREREREVLSVDEREAGTVAAAEHSNRVLRYTHNPNGDDRQGERGGIIPAENAVCLIIRHLAMARGALLYD